MRALILDDDPALCRLFSRIAAEAGFSPCATVSRAEFDREFRESVPQLVMLDLHLGDSDGIEVLRFLSNAGYLNPVILISGADRRVLVASSRLGRELNLHIAGAITKPARATELRQLLDEVFASAQPLSLERLRAGIADNELRLEFQPIVGASSRQAVSVEALVRWAHPTLGRISPDRFIPIAEQDFDCITALTDWVAGSAAQAAAALQEGGFALPVALNVSTHNIRDLDFPERLQQIAAAARIATDRLLAEVTETAVFGDPIHTNDVLIRLRLKGVEIAIDDFGTGYSSLSALKQLPFSVLKIDRSFVYDLTTSRDSFAIAKTVVDLAKNMGLGTVAEGVETEEAARILTEFGADNLQGYLISHPLPLPKLLLWLRNNITA
jgi:EAL domain-containing protein (putative c-di-GMP-specific phosphodiesterase class I)/ActR/RegA family two-component response regulator